MFCKDGRSTLMFAKLIEECDYASDAVRKIRTNGQDLKVRLASNTNDFCTLLQAAISYLNYVLPSIDGDQQVKLKTIVDNFLKIVSTLQQYLLDDLNVLQEKLVLALQAIKREAGLLNELSKGNNIFLHNQIRKAIDELMYSVNKLKYQALFFIKNIKDLDPHLNKALFQVTETDSKITTNNPIVEDELRNLLQYLETLEARMVDKLESWLRLNNNNGHEQQVVQVYCDTMSEYANTKHKLTKGNNSATFIVSNLQAMYDRGFKEVERFKDFSDIGVGGEELVRSALFDSIGYAEWYSNNLEIAQKCSEL